MKKGLDEELIRSFIHSLTDDCVLTASYTPEPVLDAEDSALCTIHRAVVFMEPSGEETADKQEHEKRNTNYFQRRLATEKINRAM